MKTEFKNIDAFKTELAADPALQADFKNDPVAAANKLQQANPLPDTWIYRLVVISLGGCIVLIIIGVILMVLIGKLTDDKIPTILTAIGSAAIGALSGLLAPSPNNNK